MGVVYKAEDVNLHRPVAVKVLPPHLLDDPGRRRRFLREARAAAAVSHPNIVHVYEVDEADGVIFLAMEYLPGRTLRSILAEKALSMKQVFAFSVQIAEGLACAHQAGIIHRDLKPENVVVTANASPTILDFGLAKWVQEQTHTTLADLEVLTTQSISDSVTAAGSRIGTVAYMSPEQAQGIEVDARSDLFSFGIMLYEMASGVVPFKGPSPAATLRAIIHQQVAAASAINKEVPAELERILGKCLEKEPADRYQDSRDLVVDLRRLKRDTESYAVRRPDPVVLPAAPARKYRTTRPILAMCAAGAIATASVYLLARYGVRHRPEVPGMHHRQITFTGDASNPAISPDGRSLVYVTGPQGEEQRLIKQDLETSKSLEIFRARTILLSEWSPDGSELLVAAFVDEEQRWGTYLIPLISLLPKRLSDGANACWLHDGSRIAVGNSNFKGFRVIDKATGEHHDVLVEGFEWLVELACSPTEDLLVLHTTIGDNHVLWTARMDGHAQS
jgi:serine/threonine protein kinase